MPLPPEVTVIHVALLTAVQLQLLPAVTVTLPVPAPALKFWLVGEMLYVPVQSPKLISTCTAVSLLVVVPSPIAQFKKFAI